MIPWLISAALADPCGMVPPLALGDTAVERDGRQRTFVLHHDGTEVLALRPGFVGDAETFGMLIPLPAAPSLHKLPDAFFEQLEDALDPTPLTVQLSPTNRGLPAIGAPPPQGSGGSEPSLHFDVDVLSTQAVGMYTAAVLQAGSAEALQRWMGANGFRFPTGMEAVCDDYIAAGWLFVAIKTRVGSGGEVAPRPGMRQADNPLPAGSQYSGHVQGLVFRFAADDAVIPMRLSVFNGADPTNVVYALTDGPVRVDGVPEEAVALQVEGTALHTRLTEPLGLIVEGGTEAQLPATVRHALDLERSPDHRVPDLRAQLAADLTAISAGSLTLGSDRERAALEVLSADLGLRGPDVDAAIADAIDGAPLRSLSLLDGMWLTVVEGVFPGELLASTNLTLSPYTLGEPRPERDDPLAVGPRRLVISVP